MQAFAEKQQYKLGNRTFHADDQAVAQYYIALFERAQEDRMIAPTIAAFNTVLGGAANVTLLWDQECALVQLADMPQRR
jgi:hypothetical protein